MIKAKNGKVKVKGETAEILAEFTAIAFGLKETMPDYAKDVFNEALELINSCDSHDEFRRVIQDKMIDMLVKDIKNEEE